MVCNTDLQALNNSPVPVRLQLGEEGLGAGNKREEGRSAAEKSTEALRALLEKNTKMVFITAGMGGGTGTGAAPVVARVCKEMDILTVGIVTIPFLFEGRRKIYTALDGVEEMSKNVDALLVINNERMRELYSDMPVNEGFAKADDILCTAARSISEIITRHTLINTDFKDVNNVLKDGGVAIMSVGYGEGEGRVGKAIEDALHSPLLNDNDIYNSKKILLNIVYSQDSRNGNNGLTFEEMSDVNDFMEKFDPSFEIKWGLGNDPELGKKVKVTILATGFGLDHVDGMTEHIGKRMTKEERERQAQAEEREMQNAQKLQKYYGDPTNPSHKRRPHVFTFNEADLDNDNIIYDIETSPTYMRTLETVKKLRRRADGDEDNELTEA